MWCRVVAAAVALCLAAGVWAQEPPREPSKDASTSTTTTPPTTAPGAQQGAEKAEAPPEPVDVPDIPAQAEETASLLRTIRIDALPQESTERIVDRVDSLHGRVRERLADTVRTLDAGPSLATLDTMLEPWMALRNRADAWITVLTSRARELEEEIEKLDDTRERWMVTQQAAKGGGAPDVVMERVATTLADVARVRTGVAAARDRVLGVLDRVTQERGRCDEAMARIGAARRAVVGRLFVRDRKPVWDEPLGITNLRELVERVGESIAVEVGALGEHLDEHTPRQLSQLVVFLVLLVLLRRMRRDARRWTAMDDSLAPILRPLEYPFECALFLVLLTYDLVVPLEQRLLREMLGLLALVPVVRLLTSLLDPWLGRGVIVLGVFFLVDRVRGLLFPVPGIEQIVFLFEMSAVLLALVWLRRGMVRSSAAADGAAVRRIRTGTQIAATLQVVVAVAVIAGTLGYMRFARILEIGVLGSSYLAAVLVVLVRIVEALIGYAIRVRPLRMLRVVQEHRRVLEHRVHRVLRIVGIAVWAVSMLKALALWESLVDVTQAVLGARFSRGELSLSLGDVLAFAVTVWIAFTISSIIRFVLQEDVFTRLRLARGLPAALSSLVHYFILLIGFFLGLAALGLDLNRVTILAGAFGVGIGFGLQNIVNNFVSGLILLIERPIQVGETVEIGDLLGEVHRIGIRSSTVRTWEGAEVIVPNGNLIADKVTNWTLSDRMRRIELPVGVEYGSDPDRVIGILLDAARAQETILPDPEPQALFLGFGDSALNFELRAWTARVDGRFEDWTLTRSDLALAVYRALGAAGISIPFPQRDVYVHTAPPETEAQARDGLPPVRPRG